LHTPCSLLGCRCQQGYMFPYHLTVKTWNQKNSGGGSIKSQMVQFNVLCTFMQCLLCLPHANVDVERVFSSVSSIKTKARNRLHTKTVHALLKVKQGVKESGGCVRFSPPAGARQRMSSDILYNSDTDSGLRYLTLVLFLSFLFVFL